MVFYIVQMPKFIEQYLLAIIICPLYLRAKIYFIFKFARI